MTDVSPYYVSHQAGQKQYELTNHLGNVQATISDLPHPQGELNIEHYAPALASAYDYYPFGMLMPGRYASDTIGKCMTISQTKWVTRYIDSCYLAPVLAVEVLGGASYSLNFGIMNVVSPASNAGISFELAVIPDVLQELSFEFDDIKSGNVYLTVSELVNGQQVNIGGLVVSGKGTARLNVKPKLNGVTITMLGPYEFLRRYRS